MLKIGIIHSDANDPILDGNDQSGYFLYKILNKIGFDARLVSFYKKKRFFGEESNCISYLDVKNFDIFINISKDSSDEDIKAILINGKKIISNIHDHLLLKLKETTVNNSLNDTFNTSYIRSSSNISFVPDNFKNISDSIEVITRSKVCTIPFLWDPDFCLKTIGDFDRLSIDKDSLNKIGIFESNQTFYKNSVIPMAICDGTERIDSSVIKFVFIANIKEKLDVRMFKHYYDNLLLKRNNKLFPYDRSGASYLISRNAINTVVSSQIIDMYSYLYNEVLFLNRPLIHNSSLYKDVGYYYNDFNLKKASKDLIEIVKNFDITKEIDKNNKFLNKFSTDNFENQNKIKEIILKEIKNEN